MSIVYNGKKIIPCPEVKITKVYERSDDECTKLCTRFNVQLIGTLCTARGSPTESGTFWTAAGMPPDTPTYTVDNALGYLLIKQEAIRDLFSDDGMWLEIQPWDNTTPTKFRPIVESIDFEEGIWVDRVDYTVNLTTDKFYGPLLASGEDSISPCVSNASETWNLELNNEANNTILTNTFRLTHNLSAKGRCFFDEDGNHKDPWKHARDFVHARAGIDYDFVTQSGAFDIPAFYRGYDHVRSTTIDELGGTYQLQESWIISSGDAVEEFTVEVRQSAQDANTTVSIQGQVKGLETRGTKPSGTDAYWNITKNKYTAASGYFRTVAQPLIPTRAVIYGGAALNTNELTKTITHNPIAGIIQYNFEYDSRPSACVSGAKFETINIQDSFPTDVFAKHTVLCRGAGTLFQNINTTTHYGRNATIEVVMEPSSGCTTQAILFGTRPDYDDIIDIIKPDVDEYYKTQHQESWNPKEGRGALSIAWEWPTQ